MIGDKARGAKEGTIVATKLRQRVSSVVQGNWKLRPTP
jgi:hypothetical protein